MLHYHVWFNLKPGVSEQEGLGAVAELLSLLSAAGEANRVQLLRNSGQPPKSKLAAYHALVEFTDQAAMDVAMAQQAKRGIHTGAHGRIVEAVCDFHVEIFTTVPAGPAQV